MDKDEILALERQYWQAIKDRDTDALARLTDDSCIVTGTQGVATLDRESVVEMLQSGSYVVHSFDLQNAEVRMLGADVAVIAYKAHEQYERDGQRHTIDAYDTSVWVRQGGSWQCAAHTESPAEPA